MPTHLRWLNAWSQREPSVPRPSTLSSLRRPLALSPIRAWASSASSPWPHTSSALCSASWSPAAVNSLCSWRRFTLGGVTLTTFIQPADWVIPIVVPYPNPINPNPWHLLITMPNLYLWICWLNIHFLNNSKLTPPKMFPEPAFLLLRSARRHSVEGPATVEERDGEAASASILPKREAARAVGDAARWAFHFRIGKVRVKR